MSLFTLDLWSHGEPEGGGNLFFPGDCPASPSPPFHDEPRKGMGLGIWVLNGRPFLGYLPFWRGRQEFTSWGTLSYNWLERNLVGGRKSKIKK